MPAHVKTTGKEPNNGRFCSKTQLCQDLDGDTAYPRSEFLRI